MSVTKPAVLASPETASRRSTMELGAFSVSLAVADMAASRDFYGKLGFVKIAGDGESWAIMANQTTAIGLFHAMFESNILTFNPGWVGLGEPVDAFTDVRELRDRLRAAGIECSQDTTNDTPSGPASFTVVDPDGNVILFDQHV